MLRCMLGIESIAISVVTTRTPSEREHAQLEAPGTHGTVPAFKCLMFASLS